MLGKTEGKRETFSSTEDEMVRWHHPLHGHEFEQVLGDGEGQGSLASMGSQGVRHFRATKQQLQYSF